MKSKYITGIIFFVLCLNIVGCTSMAKKYSEEITYNVANGNCAIVDRIIAEIPKESEFFKLYNEKFDHFRNTCKLNELKIMINKRAEQNREKEKHKKIVADQAKKQQLKDDYIRNRAITLENKKLANIGQIVCSQTTAEFIRYTVKSITRGAITNINGNNIEVTSYSTHHVLGGDWGFDPGEKNGYGFEPGELYPNIQLPPLDGLL